MKDNRPQDTDDSIVIEFYDFETFSIAEIRDQISSKWPDLKPEDFMNLKMSIILYDTSKCCSGCCPPDYAKYLRIKR